MSDSPRRVALVTGAARGIGRSIALRLAADGLDVALNDIASAATLPDVVKEIQGLGVRSAAFVADVSSEDQVENIVKKVVEEFGSLDVMVANAGILHVAELVDTTVADMDHVFSINVRGVFLCYKYAAKQMISQGRGGRIIGASSLAGKQATRTLFAYSASKFAVRGMTQGAAAELSKYDISVNAYAPSVVQTDMADQLFESWKEIGMRAYSPNDTSRTAVPEDVAAVVSFLASPGSSFVTGQTISVNGGRYFD